jgi:hypothetical protein
MIVALREEKKGKERRRNCLFLFKHVVFSSSIAVRKVSSEILKMM